MRVVVLYTTSGWTGHFLTYSIRSPPPNRPGGQGEYDYPPRPASRRPDSAGQVRANHKAEVHCGPGHHGRHAGDASRLAVALWKRTSDRGASDRGTSSDGLRGDGSALDADKPRDHGH